MTKFKSQNEVDMEDFEYNKPSVKWLDWLKATFDFSEEPQPETKDNFIVIALLFIVALAIYGFAEFITKIF